MLIGAREITDKKKLLDDIEAAGDVTISLYTRLERMALPPTNNIPLSQFNAWDGFEPIKQRYYKTSGAI
jgi:hypothetical protein